MTLISYAAKLSGHAATKPDALAVTDGTRTVTWSEFESLATATARGFLRLGISSGDYVTVTMRNSIEYLTTIAACWKIGAVPQPVSFMAPPREAQAIVELAGSKLVVGAEPGAFGGVLCLAEGWAPDAADYEGDPLPDAMSDPWKAMTSGGSTGRPKLILAGEPSRTATDAVPLFLMNPDGALMMPGPLYHNGPFVWSCAALLAGTHVVMTTKFDAETTLRLIEEHGCDVMYVVPTMMQRIWRLPEAVRTSYDVSSLRAVWHLAAPCPPWLKHAWIEWLGASAIFELYGGTEGQAATIITGNEWLAHRGSVGRPSTGEMKIVDESGTTLPAGDIGEVFMRFADPAKPTYRYIGAEARTIEGGWESLGDMGWMDADGYLYLSDRKTDMLLVGGANVYPAEIESALEEHEAVQSAVVIGFPDEDLGSRPHALVHAVASVTEDQLRAFLADRLVRYKIPRSFEFVDAPLRDDAGKVRRSALRDARLP